MTPLSFSDAEYPSKRKQTRREGFLAEMDRVVPWSALLVLIAPLRQFGRLSLTQTIPDETTLLPFRHLLERHGLAAQMLQAVNGHLRQRGLMLRQGTIVDATIRSSASA